MVLTEVVYHTNYKPAVAEWSTSVVLNHLVLSSVGFWFESSSWPAMISMTLVFDRQDFGIIRWLVSL